MNKLILIPMAAFGLIMSALSAKAADIQITSLPFNITAPGTYVSTGNLSYSTQANIGAITIATNIPGPVVLNLKGYALTGGGGYSTAVQIYGPPSNTSSITIENGTMQNFGFGVWAEANTGLSSIKIDNIAFIQFGTAAGDGTGVFFDGVNSSTVSNCTFNSANYGIRDAQSSGGNRYTNDSFVNVYWCLSVTGQNGPLPTVLEHCHFEKPAN